MGLNRPLELYRHLTGICPVVTPSCGPSHRREPTTLGSCRYLGPLEWRWGGHRYKRGRRYSWDRPMAHRDRAARARARHGAGCVPRVAAAPPTSERGLARRSPGNGGNRPFEEFSAGTPQVRKSALVGVSRKDRPVICPVTGGDPRRRPGSSTSFAARTTRALCCRRDARNVPIWCPGILGLGHGHVRRAPIDGSGATRLASEHAA